MEDPLQLLHTAPPPPSEVLLSLPGDHVAALRPPAVRAVRLPVTARPPVRPELTLQDPLYEDVVLLDREGRPHSPPQSELGLPTRGSAWEDVWWERLPRHLDILRLLAERVCGLAGVVT